MLTQVIPRSAFNNALIVGLFGILVPWIKGIEFLDVLILLPYSLLGVFFVIPLTVEAAFSSPRRILEMGRLFRAILLGWTAGIAILGLGLGIICFRAGHFIAPPAAVCLVLLLLSLFACLVTGAAALSVSVAASSSDKAKTTMRMSCLLALVTFLALPRLLDEETVALLLGLLTPEGLMSVTLAAAPLTAVAFLLFIRRAARRNSRDTLVG